jgi:hypothetical protein
LLDDIQAALLRHDYAALAPLGAALETELDSPSAPLDAKGVALIRDRARRNEATLTATARGIRAAMRRLSEMRQVGRSIVTYDRSGRHETPDPGAASGKPLGRF